jgi:CheY-like chemotaxis protein
MTTILVVDDEPIVRDLIVRDQRDRDACGDPSANERHSTAEHEDDRDRQQSGCVSTWLRQ